ncbi:Gfo/Idh/MocA family oxidoreductase [Marinomonas transparens]|uniref:Gfo/Idh/MocA family oxidoreductase n=1 Tax=Marinomonas transparens TaxID=2795388 RepID=A0A934N177_9GAMM|nr:Gfo/Idh/MocA family oxidoreductase [Marinomonas transparens]MBJ7536408.1 Gfo/Idh/MocA family oxidoreductase [Marinomonas transparens]
MTIRVGLIGFGLSGRIFHAPFVINDPEMALICVCTSQAEAVGPIAPDARVVATAREVFEANDVDLVVITTPNKLHFDQAKLALESGKHVLLEKPSVTSISEIEQLCTLAKQKNLVFCVYQNRRFDGDFLRLKALLDSGELGDLKHLDSRFDRFRPTAQARWREEPGVGTGIFWDLGPHILDQAICLFGVPDWIQSSIGSLREGGSVADWFELELGYKDKRICLGSTPFEAGEMRRFNGRFTKGSWQCIGLDPQEAALRAGQMPWDSSYPSLGAQQRVTRYLASDQNAIVPLDDTLKAGDYRQFYAQLGNAILGTGEAPVSMEQACQLIYGLCLVEQSAMEGKRLNWNYTVDI